MPMLSGLMSRWTIPCWLQVVERAEQFLAEAAQQVRREAAFLADALGERLLAGAAHKHASAAVDLHEIPELDDVRVPQGAQRFAFGGDAIVVAGFARHLEHEFFVRAVAPDQQYVGGGGSRQPPKPP